MSPLTVSFALVDCGAVSPIMPQPTLIDKIYVNIHSTMVIVNYCLIYLF